MARASKSSIRVNPDDQQEQEDQGTLDNGQVVQPHRATQLPRLLQITGLYEAGESWHSCGWLCMAIHIASGAMAGKGKCLEKGEQKPHATVILGIKSCFISSRRQLAGCRTSLKPDLETGQGGFCNLCLSTLLNNA